MNEYRVSSRREDHPYLAEELLREHESVTVLADETGGWFIEADESAVQMLKQKTNLIFKQTDTV